MERGGRGVLDFDFVFRQEVVVQGEDVATNDECGAEDFVAGVWERMGSKGEKEVFKEKIDDGGEVM